MFTASPQPLVPLDDATEGLRPVEKPAAQFPPRLGSRGLLLVCLAGLVVYLVPMMAGLQRGGAAGGREGGWQAAPIMQKDSEQYVGMASDLADFHLDELHIRTIGYPLILLAAGSSEGPSRALYFVSLLFHAATVWLLGALLLGAGVPRGWVLGFGVLMWLPPMVEPAAFVMTENASAFTLVLGLAGLVFGASRRQWGWLIAGGVGLAYSGLVHPTFQAVSLCALGVLAAVPWCLPWARLRLAQLCRIGLVVMGSFCLLIGGIAAGNRVQFGFVGLSPFTGYALSTKTVRVVEQLPDQYQPVREALVKARDADLVAPRSSHMAASYVWRVKDQLSEITGLEGVALSRYLVKLNLQLIKEAPLSYAQEVFLSCAALWAPTSGQGLAILGSPLFHALWAGLDLAINLLFVLTLMALTGLTLAARFKCLRAARARPWALNPSQIRWRALAYTLGLALVVYTTLIVAFFGPGITRYRAPIMPIVLFLAVLGVDQLWRLVRGARASSSPTQSRS